MQWLPPQQRQTEEGSGFAGGNADDLLLSVPDIQAFALDLGEVVREHLERESACTIVTTEVTRRQAAAKAVVTVRADGRVSALDDKPDDPPGTTIANEIFVYHPDALVAGLTALRDAATTRADGDSQPTLGDFGEHLLPHLIATADVRAWPMRASTTRC